MMQYHIPNSYFLVAGQSEGATGLTAFDQALGAAGIADVNLIKVSSILPPNCQRIRPITLPFGALVPVAYASCVSVQPGDLISSAVAAAIPVNPNEAGVIMEHSLVGAAEAAEAYVENMVIESMAWRNREIAEICTISAEHRVNQIGATFAAIVLWTA